MSRPTSPTLLHHPAVTPYDVTFFPGDKMFKTGDLIPLQGGSVSMSSSSVLLLPDKEATSSDKRSFRGRKYRW